ncbi:GGDEF domain-containing protein [Sphingobium aquiterrae]|uniref:GGDEF domain-containing protein n=1 Tax=Sphingobium aquiterrae TaxID=2038656 RepID=UPI00301B016A
MSEVTSERYSLPTWRLTAWLADSGPDVPVDIRHALIKNLYGSLPIFLGGVFNTIAVAAILAVRQDKPQFWAWLAMEVLVCGARLWLIMGARRRAAAGRSTQTDILIILALAWAFSVGFGTIISLTSGDWVAATLACLSAAAMVGGICLRNYSAPRLAGAMIFLGLGPCALGSLLSGQAALLIVGMQIPVYLYAMSIASHRLNRMLISTMVAERENDHRARHDALTGLLNRNGLAREMDSRGAFGRALFYLDLDGFKDVNDRFGHAAGDRLLIGVAERLRAATAKGDALARIGGDEFVVLSSVSGRSAALLTAERMVLAIAGAAYDLGMAYDHGVERVHVGVSVGIALRPQHGVDLSDLMDSADSALYRAKAEGKCRYAIADIEQEVQAPNWTGEIRRQAAS